MNYSLLEILRCPLSKTRMKFQLISGFEKTYQNKAVKEIKDGILYSETGLVFPVIDGIPRMLIEAFDDYETWFKEHMEDFWAVKAEIMKKHAGLVNHCIMKNRKTKKSFAFEWSLLNYEKQDKVWHDDAASLENLFFSESLENADTLKNKLIIDVGCGHGLNANAIAKYPDTVVGIDLGKSIENAYKFNFRENVWLLQADLQYLPFENNTFDLLLSGGVIHHTTNTELSFCNIETVLKPQGKICLWLYHPVKDFFHNFFVHLRKITSKMPVRMQFLFYLFHIFPFTYSIKKLKGRKLNWREEMIDLMDSLSPAYRFEHTHDEAASWLLKKGYADVKITTETRFGFSIIGTKH
ncbi:MAG: methyltransferase domain-containing protein [Bacteroidales bacterium]|nr:methyltransferase domain-containing protein [Bacteroidales bacterium]